MPVDGEALGTDLLGLAVAGDAQQPADAADLAGLLVQLTQQRLSRLLAEVGAAAGQVPAAGVG